MRTNQVQSQSVPPESLLLTKIRQPPIRRRLVHRSRLLSLLDRGSEAVLTLVSAPAGFGKTTLLGDWLEQRGLEVAWVSLDPADDHPTTFWMYVLQSIRRAYPGIGASALQQLETRHAAPVTDVVTALLNDIVEFDRPLVLVIEDYHLVSHPQVNSAMMYLIDHAPRELRLVMTSRTWPDLPLAQLKASGRVLVISSQDLRATQIEAEAFLRESLGLHLSDETTTELARRTDGWLAGLQLAALAMRDGRPREPGLAPITFENRELLEYLVQEVLSQLPDELTGFLEDASVLERFNAELCDFVRERDDSAALLEEVEHQNLFLFPLYEKSGWYRLHSLFAELLGERTRRSSGARWKRLLTRAGRWHERERNYGEAISCYVRAKDHDAATHLLEQVAQQMFDDGRSSQLSSWLEKLPEPNVWQSPRLSLTRGWLAFTGGDPGAVPVLLSKVRARLDEQGERAAGLRAEAAALEAHVLVAAGRAQEAVDACNVGLQALGETAAESRAYLVQALGTTHYHLGEWQSAAHAFRRAERDFDESNSFFGRMHCILALGDTERWQGNLGAAHGFYSSMIGVAKELGRAEIPIVAHAYIGMAKVFLERFLLEDAQSAVTAGLRHGASGEPTVFFDGCLTRAAIEICRGDLEAADCTLSTVHERVMHLERGNIRQRVEAFRTWIHLLEGSTGDATAWASRFAIDAPVPTFLTHFEYVTYARVLLRSGRVPEANVLLSDLLQIAQEHGRLRHTLEVMVLRARGELQNGYEQEARRTLQNALELARPEGYVRPFMQELDSIGPVLYELAGESQLGSFVRPHLPQADLVDATSAGAAGAERWGPRDYPLEPLTAREESVMRMLYGGMSNKEVAKELNVSVNTVKTHVRSIYEKLAVNSRAKLIARVNEIGLFA